MRSEKSRHVWLYAILSLIGSISGIDKERVGL